MKKSKGCFNKKCSCFTDKKFLDVKLELCPECNKKLFYVCKHEGCYKKIGDNQKYCAAHKEIHKNKAQKVLGGIGAGAAVAGSVVLTIITAG